MGMQLRSRKYFYTFTKRPINADQVTLCESKIKHEDVAIIIQGPIFTEKNFTVNTIMLYKKLFEDAQIILSTWVDQNTKSIEQIRGLGVQVIQNEYPNFKIKNNFLLQLLSTLEGIKFAKANKNVKYVLKSRTDQRIYNQHSLSLMKSLIAAFPVKGGEGYTQINRVIGISIDSFKYRIYGLGDFMHFGEIEDIERYWAPDILESYPENEIYTPEQFLCREFLKKTNWNVLDTVEDWWKALANRFIVMDQMSLDFIWPKYTSNENRWVKHLNPAQLTPITFAEWTAIHSNQLQYLPTPAESSMYFQN
jgi:hypothetical protein